MTRRISLLISWLCSAALLISPLAGLYFLINIDPFVAIKRKAIELPIQWQTVELWQNYLVLLLSIITVAVGLAGLFFLRRAFANFAKGELFNLENSNNLRRFSILLFIQTLVKPVTFAVTSLILSWNHPPGQKMLSITMGTNELNSIAVAMILWVMSVLLVEGCKLQIENREFV